MTDDVDRIAAVMAVAFAPEFGEAWTRRQIEDALVVGSCDYALIAADGRAPAPDAPAAGFALVRRLGDEEELLLLAIVPELRRRGLATGLLEQLLASAAARGTRRMLLEMRDSNPVVGLYHATGFVPVGRRRNYYRGADGARFDAITMARVIE